jgi:O-antigen/teichoic acid export membrane protein
MNTEIIGKPPHRPSLLRNWMSLTGLVVVIGSLFSFFMLLMLDAVAHFSNPYISILTWMVTPGFLIGGMILTLIGVLRARHRRAESATFAAAVQIDLSRPRDRRIMGAFLAGAVLFLFPLGGGQLQHL